MISVILASHNGASTLPLTLDAFCKLQNPEGGYEIIVVDNASSDDTGAIAMSYQDGLPLKVLHEAKPGRTYALNRGVAAASGQLIVVTDDDVLPDRAWLKNFESAADRHADISVFAGQIRLFWQKRPPRWLRKLGDAGRAYGATRADKPEEEIRPAHVKGANFMFRRTVFEDFHFGGAIGPDGTRNYAAGSETEFLLRLSEAGFRMMYIPDACLQHIVRSHQVSLKAVMARYFRIGRGLQATGSDPLKGEFATLFGYPRFLLKLLPGDIAVALSYYFRADSYRAVDSLIDVAMLIGRAYEWRRCHRRAQE